MLIENVTKEQLEYNKLILNMFIFLLFISNIFIIVGCIFSFIYLKLVLIIVFIKLMSSYLVKKLLNY